MSDSDLTISSFPGTPALYQLIGDTQIAGIFFIFALVATGIYCLSGKEQGVKRVSHVMDDIQDTEGSEISAKKKDSKPGIYATIKAAERNLIVFYGSQTGTAEDLASRISSEGKARFGLRTMVADLDDYDWSDLDKLSGDHIIVFVLATYGEGEPTDNAVEFYNYITDADNGPLPNLCFAAFGLGNSSYENYNSVIKDVTAGLLERGARNICAIGEGDDCTGTTEDTFLEWKGPMWAEASELLGLQQVKASFQPIFDIFPRDVSGKMKECYYVGELASHFHSNEPYGPRNPFVATVSGARELFRMKDRNCLHMEFNLESSGLEYQTGDHLAVWPMNSDIEVDRFLRMNGLIDQRNEVVEIQPVDSQSRVPIPSPTTYGAIARYYLEVGASVSRELVTVLADFAPNDEARNELLRLGKDKVAFAQVVTAKYLNIAKLLEVVGKGKIWHRVPFSLYIERLSRLQPRYYSISSSSIVSPKTVSITAVVESQGPSSTADAWKGVATNYLLAIKQATTGDIQLSKTYNIAGPRKKYCGGRIPVHIRASKFRLPSDPSVPIVMVGPGTGVAPFRAFVQERAAQASTGHQVGLALLFYGCRNAIDDYIYEEDWKV